MPDRDAAEHVRIATHLAYVEQMLRDRPVDHLTEQQARRRVAALDHLRSYRIAGEFPQNTTHVDRMPVFIDRDGRICAVGYLIEQTAGRTVSEAINERFPFAHISEIDMPALPEHHGFTLHELGMIQPAYIPNPPSRSEEEASPVSAETTYLVLNASSVFLNGPGMRMVWSF